MAYCCLLMIMVSYIFISSVSAYNETNDDCELYKLKCHNDTDCFHRIFYTHSTCITGKCKSQCKTAILRLYETDFGRKILHSDLACLESVKTEIIDCHLNPGAEQVHCTLARQMCDSDTVCHTSMNSYEAMCDNKMLMPHECRPECIPLLAKVFNTEEGQKLANCVCWPEDALCHHMKSHVIDPCRSDAQLYLSDPKKFEKSKVNEFEDKLSDVDQYRSQLPTSSNIGSKIVFNWLILLFCFVIRVVNFVGFV